MSSVLKKNLKVNSWVASFRHLKEVNYKKWLKKTKKFSSHYIKND